MTIPEATIPPITSIADRAADQRNATITANDRDIEIGAQFRATNADVYQQWLRLFAADTQAAIAMHPDAVLSEADDALLADSRPSYLFLAADGESLTAAAAIVPKQVRTSSTGAIGPSWNLNGYRLAGGNLLGDRTSEHAQRVIANMADFVRSQCADFLLVEDLEPDDPLYSVLNKHAKRKVHLFAPTGFQKRWRIAIPENAADYWTQFSSKTRNTFRRKVKKMGNVRLQRVTEPNDVPTFLVCAHEISKNSWQSERLGLRVSNDLAELQLLTFQAEQGALRSYLLFVDERPVAFLIGNQFRGSYRYEEVGYDRAVADKSPGQVLLIKALEDLVEFKPPQHFDFGGGHADYKALFGNRCSESGNVWLVPRGWRQEMTLAYLRLGRGLDRTARSVLSRLGLYQRARQMFRQ